MYKILFSFCLFATTSCTSNNADNDKKAPTQETSNDATKKEADKSINGEPTKEEAKQIVQDWFDHFEHLVGGTSYTAESFDVTSVTGDAKQATINFKWTGTITPASLPGNDLTPQKVKDGNKALIVKKANEKWEVIEER